MGNEALEAALLAAARSGRPVTYGKLAAALALQGPRRIARLAEWLEAQMAEDAAAGRPFRAAWAAGRARGGLPAEGFYATAQRLGRYNGPHGGPEAAAYVAAERASLRALLGLDGRA
ncbi:hypothetical protein [Rhodobaculum claviforme]|uniref:Uncharacterized protein n=1 Tax=Rhodobaculum claviforme TaxID=1549854 RepID=A0A934TIU6_9RHOB|nr:hypothetical protein [Rhodobaculum claviforme]MBK5926945.1 hypothetical protein [Rhodobaculum claviforme]